MASMVDQLRASGVKTEICNNTLKGMDVDRHTLYEVHESDIVASGFLEVGWLANQGWAVEAMNRRGRVRATTFGVNAPRTQAVAIEWL